MNHKINFEELDYMQDTTLRDYQVENKKKIYEAWQTCRGVMLQMPTGTGKTRLFVSIVRDLHKWGATHKTAIKVLILAHRKELIEQISETLGIQYNQAHGLIISQSIEQRKFPVQVGSVPTLNRRLERWTDKNFDIIIIDEAHHVKAQSYKEIIKQYPSAKILGVTATPYRLNGAGFRPEFDKLIVSDAISDFIKKGYLSDYQYYSISPTSELQSRINNMKIDKLDGDYLDSEMMDVMDRQKVRAKIVDTYLKYAKGKKGIIYTVNKNHNLNIKKQFEAAGIRAEIVDSETSKHQRDKVVDKFRKGYIDVLCNVNIFSEGFDCPDIEFIQLARPTCSLALYLQQVGRGLRPAEGKDNVIILDNVGLYNKFGFPSASRKWQFHFEGKDATIDIFTSTENSDDDLFREVIPIEEGDEEVILLHDSNKDTQKSTDTNTNSESNMNDEIFKLEYQQLKSAIETIKAMGEEVPQDWLAKLEGYKCLVDPTAYIQKSLNDYIENNFNSNVVLDFAYHSKSKPSLSKESTPIKKQLISAQNDILKIKQVIQTCNNLQISLPQYISSKTNELQTKIDIYESQLDFLSKVEQQLNILSNKYTFGITFQNNEITKTWVQVQHRATTPNVKEFGNTPLRPKLSITLPNGTVIKHNIVAETFADFIRFAGIEHVAQLNLTCCGLPLVSKQIGNKYHSAHYPIGNGWYLLTQSSTATKIRYIETIAAKLQLNIEITLS